ncbi:Xaa-Pro aminopeptidase [Halogranum amylolyticum]|uniref:Xaa-Pro aminopeptidase n=1 Tax=Halogranum amylolyticum TaxID=660520 RepID=A0A1H8QE06_9EURY|nr:M24 family metallopeptidase [Halogranum amylolyticum]SEO52238.1 Xaa-Pro aminopeptidase [Halogranum amylolyticum]
MTVDEPISDYGFLADALDAADADAFVHVGDADADLRYLAPLSETTSDYGFVYAGGEATLCAPADATGGSVDRVAADFPGDVRREAADDPVGTRVVDTLADRDVADGATVLVPRQLPHDAAVYLESAGYDLASTPAVREARAVKSDRELDRLRAVQRAAVRGVERARSILRDAAVREGTLHWQDAPLSTERLRRQVNATLVGEGVADVAHTRVRVGTATARSAVELSAGTPLVVSLAPRGPHGYYGRLVRTFVVDSDGGWERRAHVGVESARRVALDELDPGESLRWVHSETVAEASSFGLTATEGDRVYGVGLTRREGPSLADEATVGNVVAVHPSATDEERGTVALADLAVVTEEGCELLVDCSTSLVP